jgi:outer membrane protein TolC
MKHIFKSLFIFLFLPLCISAQKELRFNNLDSLYAFADKNSSVSKTNEQQTLLAKYQKIAALANTINLRNPVALTLTNNTQLPVSFVPAQLLGGKPGEFKQLTLGQQYVSNFSISPQIDIINPGTWAQIRSANVNMELTSVTNQLNKKQLYESIAACFYNINGFQDQESITGRNVAVADTLAQIVTNKFNQGLARQQDVNDAVVNKITLEDKLTELRINLEEQYNSLKILCDLAPSQRITLEAPLDYTQQFKLEQKVTSTLQFRSALLQEESAKADLRYNRLTNLPVLSLFYSDAYYQNSNAQFFDANPNNKWLNSTYIGAKITFSIPDVNKIVACRNSHINYQIARINVEHNRLQNDLSNEQLRLDYEKAYAQYLMTKQVYTLKDENYKMAFNQFNQAILPFDKLLTAFNDALVSRFNFSNALAALNYAKTKIEINNTLK